MNLSAVKAKQRMIGQTLLYEGGTAVQHIVTLPLPAKARPYVPWCETKEGSTLYR